MSIDAEQNSLRARHEEALKRLTFARERENELRSAAELASALAVLRAPDAVRELITPAPGPVQSPAEFLDAVGEDGWDPDVFAPYLAEARDVVHGCFDMLLEAVESTEDGHSRAWQPVRRELGLPADDFDDVREEVHEQLKASRAKQLEEEAELLRRRQGGVASLLSSSLAYPRIPSMVPITVPNPVYGAAMQGAKRQRIDAATDEFARAEFEFGIADQALSNAALPSNLMTAVWVLIALTGIGLVLPVVALYALPSYDSASWRTAVLVAFCVGIAGLLTYLWLTARRLGPAKRQS